MRKFLTNIIVFVFLFDVVFSQCYVKKNNFLEIKTDNTGTSIKAGICGEEGWSSLAFSTTTSINDFTFGVINFKTNKTKPLYTLASHFTLSKQISYISLTNEKTFHYFRMNAISFHVNQTFNWNYAIFSCKRSSSYFFNVPVETPTTSFNETTRQFIFQPHNNIDIIAKGEISHCYPNGYQETDFTVSKELSLLWFLNIFVLIVLLAFCVFFRNREPFSTRGYVPFFALGLFFLESINSFLYIVSSTFEFVYHYDCFFSGAFYTPARMTLIVLFFFVNVSLN
jgi:hypothetical protein